MEHIESTIKNYLSRQTSYSILINGAWGSGKTHYFRKSIVPLIDSTSIVAGETKYKTIYISLFGVETIDEINNGILYQLEPILKTKGLQITKTIFTFAAKYIRLSDEDVNKLFKTITTDEDGNLQFRRDAYVICFDDFERRGNKLELNTILGYISDLVENNVKVVIIANEDKDSDPNTFKTIKEKSVGITVNFTPNLSNLLTELINEKYKTEYDFKGYMLDNKDYVVALLEGKSDNLRTVIYFLDCFLDIIKFVDLHLINENAEKLDEIKRELLKFSLAITIEFRQEKLKFNTLDEFDILNYRRIWKENSMNFEEGSTETNNEQLPHEKFYHKYYHGSTAYFFYSIAAYITTFDKSRLSSLQDEIVELFSLVRNDIPEQTRVYNLLWNGAYSLPEKDYNDTVKKVLGFVAEGKYRFMMAYYNAFNMILNFDNTVELNVEELLQTTIEGAKKAELDNYDFDLDFVEIDEKYTFRDYRIRLIEELNKIVRTYVNDINKERSKALEMKFSENDFSVFFDYEFVNLRHLHYPYFKDFSAENFLKKLNEKTPEYILKFRDFLKTRDILDAKLASTELDFFLKINDGLSELMTSNRKTRALNKLLDEVQITIDKINRSSHFEKYAIS